ncbi:MULTISPECIES: Co2+/Mg2+ efflux protein ApaG [Microvirgula]|uniref:Protein ApaG n=1 Tax=Microvirgula aerodenitrificans TaxID=57480 RepID=A0A2S0PC20_9NEIS|nr:MULTISPECIES: Co2+/Mg2+ efflux protein ApaG [Microvirgula]AVY94873.1 Co2+/Mg2+ efflux protein ApaG [Microvirgula aerodenitrificans]RAS17258.1 uncharacterized protein affecting Mg2+/Co2+ transport [Microvirgula sp. AG722]
MQNNKYAITVEPQSFYIENQSAPDDGQYVFAYRIRITNAGTVSAQLQARHWIITDDTGHVEEVHGEGVVGEKPTLAPGESFEYVSGAGIGTPYGTMRGSYQMLATDGTPFEAEIPEFTLLGPRVLH